MTDREMVQKAADAIGLKLHWDVEGVAWKKWPSFKWNPLTDDGDAFRLAVALDLDLMRTERDIEAIATLAPHAKVNAHGIVTPSAIELIGDDKASATRRAITRAAAAIQEAKEGA